MREMIGLKIERKSYPRTGTQGETKKVKKV